GVAGEEEADMPGLDHRLEVPAQPGHHRLGARRERRLVQEDDAPRARGRARELPRQPLGIAALGVREPGRRHRHEMRSTPLEGVVRAAWRLAAGDGGEEVAVRAPAHEVVVSGRGEEGDAGEHAPVGAEEARVEGGRARGRVGHVAQVDEEGRAPGHTTVAAVLLTPDTYAQPDGKRPSQPPSPTVAPSAARTPLHLAPCRGCERIPSRRWAADASRRAALLLLAIAPGYASPISVRGALRGGRLGHPARSGDSFTTSHAWLVRIDTHEIAPGPPRLWARPIFAPFTCRAPAWPRSCVASS